MPVIGSTGPPPRRAGAAACLLNHLLKSGGCVHEDCMCRTALQAAEADHDLEKMTKDGVKKNRSNGLAAVCNTIEEQEAENKYLVWRCGNHHREKTWPTGSDYSKTRNYARYKILARIKKLRGCATCGYDKNSRALEWDHLDISQKLGGVSQLVHDNKNWFDILCECLKCQVLCRNCHCFKSIVHGDHWG